METPETMCKICSSLTIKTPERHYRHRLNKFHTLFWYFYCWHWKSKCRVCIIQKSNIILPKLMKNLLFYFAFFFSLYRLSNSCSRFSNTFSRYLWKLINIKQSTHLSLGCLLLLLLWHMWRGKYYSRWCHCRSWTTLEAWKHYMWKK